MLSYLFAALAACANAASSVLQRKADSEESSEDNLSLRLIVDLLHKPVWFLGILGVIAGFLLQAAALSNGALAVVEPILIIELPITLLVAGVVFHRRLHVREWTAALAMTVGLAGLLYFLSPSGGAGAGLSWYTWTIGIGVNLAVIGALIAAARRGNSGGRRAALLGVAGGSSFGLTAALMKAMTDALNAGGVARIFTTWQTYAMIVAGGLAMFLLQSSLNAGPLVAAQPGLTSADPVVSILWGVLAFGEHVHTGFDLAVAALAAAVVGWGVFRLSRSPLVAGQDSAAAEQAGGPGKKRTGQPGEPDRAPAG